MNEAAPERCAACSCKKAQVFAKQIDDLKMMSHFGALMRASDPAPATAPELQ
jgi:hypothetical protein